MHDDAGNQNQRGPSVKQQGQANHRNRKHLGKIRPPSDKAGAQQHRHAGGHQPKHAFLAAIILAYIAGFVAFEHGFHRFHPFDVFFIDEIVFPIAEKLHRKADKHHHAHKGMDDARQLRRAKHAGEPEKGRIEKRQAGNGQQHKTHRHNPVVDALAALIALNQFFFHYASSSPFRFLPSKPITSGSSSSGSAVLGPTVM